MGLKIIELIAKSPSGQWVNIVLGRKVDAYVNSLLTELFWGKHEPFKCKIIMGKHINIFAF